RQDPDSQLWKDVQGASDLYNRGGFSKSYLFEKNPEKMMDRGRTGHYGVKVGVTKFCNGKKAEFEAKVPINAQDVLEFRDQAGERTYEFTTARDFKEGEVVSSKILPGSPVKVGQEVFRTRNNKLLDSIEQRIEEGAGKFPLQARFEAKIGQRVSLEIRGRGLAVKTEGDLWQEAKNRPLQEEDIEKKLAALGNTPYVFEQLDFDMEEGFMSLGGLKGLRRQALAAWEEAAKSLRSAVAFQGGPSLEYGEEKKRIVSLSNLDQLRAAISMDSRKIYAFHLKLADLGPEDWQEAAKLLEDANYWISFPPILRGEGRENWDQIWQERGHVFEKASAFVINSQVAWLYGRQCFSNLTWITAENMYEYNGEAKKVYQDMGARGHMSQVYGRIEAMKTRGPVPVKSLQTPRKDAFVVVDHPDYGYRSIYTKNTYDKKAVADFAEWNFTLESPHELVEVIRTWN
ncbi:MAG: DUF3656 domain-containing protein, partial [Eubacterium sp.]|nr:DUF3656 domain-containing protein [Eubacterium sp.]